MEQTEPTRRRMTPKQRDLLKNLIKGMTLTDAARKAGYTEKSPGQSGYQAMKGIRLKVPDVMEKQGLSDKKLIKKYLKPALDAMETKFFQKDGKVVETQDVIAWDVRLHALDMAFNLKGSYAPKEIEHTGNIIHEITELEKRKALGSVEKMKALEVIEVTPIDATPEEASARD
jgi:phage terminase small subunit